MTFNVREVEKKDAKKVVDLMNEIDNQTSCLLFESGERPTTEERIKEIVEIDHISILLAEQGEEFLGYLLILGVEFKRREHAIEIVAGVKKKFWGKGVGTALLKDVEKWAGEHGIHRIHLTVDVGNEGAYKLYTKFGYTHEGTSKDTRLVNGEYHDEHIMAKILG